VKSTLKTTTTIFLNIFEVNFSNFLMFKNIKMSGNNALPNNYYIKKVYLIISYLIGVKILTENV